MVTEPESESDDDIPVIHRRRQPRATTSASREAVRGVPLSVDPNPPAMVSTSTLSMHGGHAIIHRYVAGDDSVDPVKNIRLHAGRIYVSLYRSSGYDSFFEVSLNNFAFHIPSKDPVVRCYVGCTYQELAELEHSWPMVHRT